MFRLLAFHNGRRLDREFLLIGGSTYILGRGADAGLHADWDDRISRRHVELHAEADGVTVRKLPQSSNPLFVDGDVSAEATLASGEAFVIGATRFEVQQVTQSDSPGSRPIQQLAINRQQLEGVRYDDAAKRIEVLTSLPAVIRESGVERDLHIRLASLLLAGVQNADGVAIVGLSESQRPRVFHQEQRFETGRLMQPSVRLISEAMEQQTTILHVWDDAETKTEQYTQVAGYGWAWCTPFTDITTERAFYITGRSLPENSAASERRLHADIKFTEFIADIVGSLQRQRRLERQQSGLRQFFSPPILEALGRDLDTSMLEPRECDVTVLFCDLRGFSHRAEEESHNLTGLLEQVSLALEVMTSQILRFGGVTGDFQGDAALGFWGWPLASDAAPLNACRAALAIREEFSKAQADPDHPLKDFETSIGIAHGRAVAGKIGTREQVKVTVFGPVVNLASRLESMTRELHVSVLIDEFLDKQIREKLPKDEGRVRRLLQVLPYGMDRTLLVSELVPPESHCPALTDQHLADFEKGVALFISGQWSEAWKYLHRMPAEDRAQDYLSMLITQHDRKSPADWDGIVHMKKKSG
ncbi:MAG: adenylate/guanylate cyclase domain-containing protein [Planctomycetaceae bacterium]|nr:adenylate/guanylate cyclase domain-containing protein [Planctomycetaceae bacterium]